MKINYDPKVDAMYIQFKIGKYDHTKKISDEILVDVNNRGEVLGLEILDAKKQFGKIEPAEIQISSKPSYQNA